MSDGDGGDQRPMTRMAHSAQRRWRASPAHPRPSPARHPVRCPPPPPLRALSPPLAIAIDTRCSPSAPTLGTGTWLVVCSQRRPAYSHRAIANCIFFVARRPLLTLKPHIVTQKFRVNCAAARQMARQAHQNVLLLNRVSVLDSGGTQQSVVCGATHHVSASGAAVAPSIAAQHYT